MDYCKLILSKIDELYGRCGKLALPFICVEGSSGMGKSQLAFALGGSRPWFYWPVEFRDSSQRIYQNFSSISKTFREVTDKDNPKQKFKEDILNTESLFYETQSLWTFGFIHALLEHCSKDENQHGNMIRFKEEVLLCVEKCKREKVMAFRNKMKAERKLLPFFVLDEMTSNINRDGSGGKNVAAFQRNVFRVCGLVVVVMGTDVKITNLLARPIGSRGSNYPWMTIISRFPPYQSIPFADKNKDSSWNHLQDKYPVLKNILVNSRGLFARYFADSSAEYALENSAKDFKLFDLLDKAFGNVSLKSQANKRFMETTEGRYAQLVAVSYSNVGSDSTSSSSHKNVGAEFMHLHFANLVDDQATEVDINGGHLRVNDRIWKPFCCFPDITKDVLLYLAILGVKDYSAYYDRGKQVGYSTMCIFSEYSKRTGFTADENINAISNDYNMYENMVAHMIFCASRRNGVQGIPFDDFFAGLLIECQDTYYGKEVPPVTMTMGGQTIVASDLFEKYANLADLSLSQIPFLAPPNAKWPPYILHTCAEGCNFGHLVRARNAERCDIYVCNMEDTAKPPLFLCECKFLDKNMGFGMMCTIIDGIQKVWNEKWAVSLVFCVKLATFRSKWKHKEVGCVKVDCQSGHVDWIYQPAEEKRKKLIIVMETGPLTVA